MACHYEDFFTASNRCLGHPPLGRRGDRSESFRGDNPGGVAADTGAGCKRVVADDIGQAERLADSKGNGDHSSSGSGSECKPFILPGAAEIEPCPQKIHRI